MIDFLWTLGFSALAGTQLGASLSLLIWSPPHPARPMRRVLAGLNAAAWLALIAHLWGAW